MEKNRTNTRKIAMMGVMGALSIVLVLLIHLPILPAAPFLEYDPADIPILIVTFTYGPLAGLCLTAIVAVIQGVTVSFASGVYGIIMHVIATGVNIFVAGLLYRVKKNRPWAVVGLVGGGLARAAVMIPANLLFTPLFLGQGVGDVIGLLLPAIIPFNLLLAGINAVFVFVLYKHAGLLMKGEPLRKSSGYPSK